MLVERRGGRTQRVFDIGESTRARSIGAARRGHLIDCRPGAEDPFREGIDDGNSGESKTTSRMCWGSRGASPSRLGEASPIEMTPIVDAERDAEVFCIGGHRSDVVLARDPSLAT